MTLLVTLLVYVRITKLGYNSTVIVVGRMLSFRDTLPSHPKSRKSKYPKIDHGYESVDYPGLYYAGTVTHSLDLRKSAGGFIHGIRYTGEYTCTNDIPHFVR